MKCHFCNVEFKDGYFGNNPDPITKNFKEDVAVCESCNTNYVLPIRKMNYKKLKDDDKDIFILIDNKLTAIIGVFSSLEKVKEVKKALIKRDIKLIQMKINEEIALSKITQERKHYLIGILNIISYILTNYDDKWESVLLQFDDACPHNRYLWYKTEKDRFNADSSTFGPIILIPPPQVYDDNSN